MTHVDMGAFWDDRARENAAYFVDNRLDYEAPDLEVFWAGGAQVVDVYVESLGLEIAPGETIVEIGCGIGRLTRVLAERAGSVMALDVSREMLAQARQENPSLAGVEWMHGDGTSLTGVPDGSADGVFSHVVFQHVPSAEITYGYIEEMGRVLRPGGWAAFQVSDSPEVHRPRRSLRRLIERGDASDAHPAWRGSAVDLDVLRRRADAAGLDTVRVVHEGTQHCLVRLRRR